MLEWAILPFKRYAEFSGRSRRKEFWSFALLNAIVYVVITAIVFGTGFSFANVLQANPGEPLAIYSAFFSGAGLLFVLWWLVTILPGIALTVRRLHDRDLSGWWYLGFLIVSFIPLIGFVASIAFLVFMFLDGTKGPNRFGPDPKDPTGVEVFS